jgi:hypothetical protein
VSYHWCDIYPTSRTFARAGTRLSWNAERYLKPPSAMAQLFNDLPQALAETRTLADRIGYTMADLGYRFPQYPVPSGETMGSFLRKITQAGARERYRPYDVRARRQIERELIDGRGFARIAGIPVDRLGYEDAVSVTGGFTEWAARGHPLWAEVDLGAGGRVAAVVKDRHTATADNADSRLAHRTTFSYMPPHAPILTRPAKRYL